MSCYCKEKIMRPYGPNGEMIEQNPDPKGYRVCIMHRAYMDTYAKIFWTKLNDEFKSYLPLPENSKEEIKLWKKNIGWNKEKKERLKFLMDALECENPNENDDIMREFISGFDKYLEEKGYPRGQPYPNGVIGAAQGGSCVVIV